MLWERRDVVLTMFICYLDWRSVVGQRDGTLSQQRGLHNQKAASQLLRIAISTLKTHRQMRPIRRSQWKPWVNLERWWPILCNHWLWLSNIMPRLELQLKQAGLRTEKIYWIYWMFCPFLSSNMTLKNKDRLGFLVKTVRKISGCCQDRLLAIYNKHVLKFDSLLSGCHFIVSLRRIKRFFFNSYCSPSPEWQIASFVVFYCCYCFCFYLVPFADDVVLLASPGACFQLALDRLE